ncbi:hypothetical protein G6F59_014176 [Rhizopus arrhizus]|nr:hypothetical protein G6F59_014176 [Rhizopus arrhizus]
MRGQSIPLIDAQVALGFVIAQTTIIEPGVYRTVYPDIQYRGLIPVDTEGSEFATSVTYMSQDQFGKADWINGNADDIPKAGTTRAKFETPVYTAGIGYGYGFEEIGRAQLLGINLPSEYAAAARRLHRPVQCLPRRAYRCADRRLGHAAGARHRHAGPDRRGHERVADERLQRHQHHGDRGSPAAAVVEVHAHLHQEDERVQRPHHPAVLPGQQRLHRHHRAAPDRARPARSGQRRRRRRAPPCRVPLRPERAEAAHADAAPLPAGLA